MDISLKPELEVFVSERVRTGAYADPNELVNEAISLLKYQEDHDPLDTMSEDELEEVRHEVQLGVDSLDRGEGIVIEGREGLSGYFAGIKSRGRERLQTKQQDQ